jgi:hypothetical protein
MSKDNENEKGWKYSGSEEEWDVFDQRMMRHMRKKYDDLENECGLGRLK